MTEAERINIVINSLVALGTIAVAILAIWGDWVRSRVAGPKLSIAPHNLRGVVIPISNGPISNGPLSVFYHLKVVNKRDWVNATNCRVLLKKIWRKAPNGSFQEAILPVPLTFVWAPAEITPAYISLQKEHIFDFGLVIKGQDRFMPRLISITNNFQGYVFAGDVVRYGLEIVSDNFVSRKLQIVEVAWNGQWSDNLDEMSNNLQIQGIEN